MQPKTHDFGLSSQFYKHIRNNYLRHGWLSKYCVRIWLIRAQDDRVQFGSYDAAKVSLLHFDCIRSLRPKQRLSKIVIVKPEIANFWEEVRRDLRRDYGQDPGKRDRKKAGLREHLARDLRLSGRTLKAFLNGNQAGLGPEALFALLAKMPALKLRYMEAVGSPDGSLISLALPTGEDHGLHVQLTLQFEGPDGPPKMLTVHLPPGREGILTLKIDSGRVA